MSHKRRNTSSPECDSPPKEQHIDTAVNQENSSSDYDGLYDDADESQSGEQPQIDVNSGQVGAFPGLSGNDEPFYGPANDGLDYLLMVRSEAKGVPQLLKAQAVQDVRTNNDNDAEEGGYWDTDGTYTARPALQQCMASSSLPQAQELYYQSLLVQFNVVRATMKCIPPLSAIEKLTSSQPISFPSDSKNAKSIWEQCLKSKDPSPTQVACMDQKSVFELVRLIEKKMRGLFQQDELESVKRLGSWIWAILGKCADRGELGSEEISDLRQLAQKAVNTRDWLDKKCPSAQLPHKSGADAEAIRTRGDGIGMASGIEAARKRLAQSNADEVPQISTRTTPQHREAGVPEASSPNNVQQVKKAKLVVLDMIVMVVGEVYGQRDLLDSRKAWSVQSD